MQKIIAPSSCPSCGFGLTKVQDLLYCYNESCQSKSEKIVEHFAKTLKIKGLGPSTIKKLNITSITQIYELSLEEITESLNSIKLATKLFEEIQESKKASLSEVLPGFSIPLVGRVASSKLCSSIKSIYELNEDVCISSGLGPKATENLLNWYNNQFLAVYKWLPFSFESVETESPKVLAGVVCISGRLTSFKTKAEAEKALISQGYVVKSSLTKDVNILVNESGLESSKTKKARENGISIVTNLETLIGN